jgi:hypothetical protein
MAGTISSLGAWLVFVSINFGVQMGSQRRQKDFTPAFRATIVALHRHLAQHTTLFQQHGVSADMVLVHTLPVHVVVF